MKYVTIRLLVDDWRARRLQDALETTARAEGHFGVVVENHTLYGFEIEDQDASDTATKEGGRP